MLGGVTAPPKTSDILSAGFATGPAGAAVTGLVGATAVVGAHAAATNMSNGSISRDNRFVIVCSSRVEDIESRALAAQKKAERARDDATNQHGCHRAEHIRIHQSGE
jgi:hypothetical protein